jgi:hypothetical protein
MKTWIHIQRSGMHKSKDHDGIHVFEEVHTMNKLHEKRLSAFDGIYKASYSTANTQRLSERPYVQKRLKEAYQLF